MELISLDALAALPHDPRCHAEVKHRALSTSPQGIATLSLPPSPLPSYLDAAREAALLAWEQIRPFFRGTYSIIEKTGEGPATEADVAADHCIVDFLRSRFPSERIGFLTEETHQGAERLSADCCWIVDPIDGTRSFIDGTDGWAVQIGLAGRTEPGGPLRALVGVVYQPTTGLVYTGAAGLGARVESLADGWTRPMAVSPQAELAAARVAVTNSHIDRRTRAALDRLAPASVSRLGSAGLKIMEVASGRADLYLSVVPRRCKEWDVCGPAAILLAAGGTVSDLEGGELAYNRQDYGLERGFLASNGPLHAPTLARLAEAPGKEHP